MKISLFLVFLIASSAFADSNNQCLLNSGAPGTACVTRDQCALNLGCVSGTCQLINLGKTCSANADCGGLYPFCIGGRCDAKRVPGDPCSMNEQCISGQCTGSICISKQLNEACGGSDCAPGLYCNPTSRVCSNKLAVNAVCSNEYLAMVNNVAFAHDLTVMCSDSALCDYSPATDTQAASGTCTPIFTSNQGTRCGAFGSFTCPIGSTCNNNNQCQALSGNDIKCASGAQCSGISTFCACENTNNQNLQVFQTSQNQAPTTKGYTRQLGASANVAGASANVGTSGTGVSAAGQSASVGTQGAAVGVGQQGAAVGVGQQGAVVGVGQQGAVVGVGQQGAAVGVGQQGVAVGTGGTTVAVSGGGVAINTANFQGICTTDNCYNSFAPDYYSCLLQNGCGLTTEPIFINGTCASSCAFLYSRLQCCQAGFQPIISAQSQGGNNNNGVSVSVNTNNNNNNNNNNLQRSVALPPQIQCVGFQQPPAQALSAGSAVQVGVILVASLVGALLF